MKTAELYKKKSVLSYEVFPPKTTDDAHTIYEALDGLQGLCPDFISVTYGAGGGTNCAKTLDIAAAVKNQYKIESVAHLRGLDLSRDEVLQIIGELKEKGIENVLALRGDAVQDMVPMGDFKHADELIAFLRAHSDLNILAACYPEGHPECKSLAQDIAYLKRKADAGASQLITQFFLDNEDFYGFLEKVRAAGITLPIQAGIMPVTNRKSIERMVKMCGIKLPKKFMRIMDRYEHSPAALRDAGIAYAIDQVIDLLAHDVDGIHLYIMNKPYTAKRIFEAVQNIISA